MKEHPLSAVLPSMPKSEYRELKESIAGQGLLEPITIYEGQILDRRNRYRACQELKLEPKTEEYKGKDPLGYVLGRAEPSPAPSPDGLRYTAGRPRRRRPAGSTNHR